MQTDLFAEYILSWIKKQAKTSFFHKIVGNKLGGEYIGFTFLFKSKLSNARSSTMGARIRFKTDTGDS